MTVELVNPTAPHERIVVPSMPAVLGRDSTVDVCLKDLWVDPCHCTLEFSGGVLRVLDLGSRTGTFVNGRRIQRAALPTGSMLTIGRTDFVVHYRATPERSLARTAMSAHSHAPVAMLQAAR
jgi:pSer/pThr/pTyr-binding forkhead associated (FHA) protein